MPRVMIHPATYQDCLVAVRRAFELFPQPIAGKKVLIKPNVLRASSPDEHITTNPAILAAVVACVEERRPAEIIVGDNPGLMSYGANEASFRKCGLLDAAGGHYRNIGLEAVEQDFNPAWLPKVSVSRAVLQADVLISLPKFKTHGLTVLTGAVKNSYGILPGAQKALLHRKAGSPPAFHEMVVDVFRLRPPDLFIMDAVVGMQGNGPASTELRWIGQVLAADNAVALDAVVARMMGLDPARLRFLQRARELGLGDYDPAGIELDGALAPIPEFKLPPLGGEAIAGNPNIQQLMQARSQVRPQADPERCTACGTCVDQCPVGALALVDDLPRVDPERCITCFCCQEMCPEKAISLR
ncbi:MAG: DUF362 domain-containing protein [Desulfarculus sp.]|nr:DUF362 domain-containing protein [Desulfarculus sp.]